MADDPSERDALEHEVERTLDRQRWTIDNARIAVVFSAGVGISVGAAAWQSLGATDLTLAAAGLLGISLLVMVFSFASDERHTPMVEELIADAARDGYSVRDAIASYNRSAANLGEFVVSTVVWLSFAQALLTLCAAALATIAMLFTAP